MITKVKLIFYKDYNDSFLLYHKSKFNDKKENEEIFDKNEKSYLFHQFNDMKENEEIFDEDKNSYSFHQFNDKNKKMKKQNMEKIISSYGGYKLSPDCLSEGKEFF